MIGLLFIFPISPGKINVIKNEKLVKESVKRRERKSVKQREEEGGNNQLFKWVAILTGSKNALKGVGFFLGGLLLTSFGFNKAVELMAIGLGVSFLLTLLSGPLPMIVRSGVGTGRISRSLVALGRKKK